MYHVSFLRTIGQAILLLLAMPEPVALLANSVLGGCIEIAVRIGVLWLLRRSRPEPDAPDELWAKWNRTVLVMMNNTQGDMIVAYLASNMAVMMQVVSSCSRCLRLFLSRLCSCHDLTLNVSPHAESCDYNISQ